MPTATAAPAATAAPTAVPGATSPQTGDETNLALWALMLLGCGAAQDDITSVLSLGQMYELGEGVEQDGAKAAELYQRGLTWGTITAFTGSHTCTGKVLPWSRTMTRPCAFISLSWTRRPRMRMNTGPRRRRT